MGLSAIDNPGVEAQDAAQRAMPSAVSERAEWDAAFTGLKPTRASAFLRAYSDAVNRALIARWLAELDGARVLKTDAYDEAVGAGLYPALAAAGAMVVCTDLSPATLEGARRRYPGLSCQQADARELPFPDLTFDSVVSNSTLDHLPSLGDVSLALNELYRVLKVGGTLLITLDNPINPLVALRNALPGGLLARVGAVQYRLGATCGPRRLAGLLRSSGFKVDSMGAVMHFPRLPARALAALLGDRPGFQRAVLSFERLGSLPTRYLTGQFVAARAVKR